MNLCEDCGGGIAGTNAELLAQSHGLLICEACIASMDNERDAYEQEFKATGVECVFTPERGFFLRRR